MIFMYPTPLLGEIRTLHPEYTSGINYQIFWYFWTGIYVSACDLFEFTKFLPMQYLFIILIFEKLAQRWLTNRFGCTFEKIQYFKNIEEKKQCVRDGRNVPDFDYDIMENAVKPESQFVTIGDA